MLMFSWSPDRAHGNAGMRSGMNHRNASQRASRIHIFLQSIVIRSYHSASSNVHATEANIQLRGSRQSLNQGSHSKSLGVKMCAENKLEKKREITYLIKDNLLKMFTEARIVHNCKRQSQQLGGLSDRNITSRGPS